MDIIKQHLNPIFRPRVYKPYCPVAGPFKTGQGRVQMHLGCSLHRICMWKRVTIIQSVSFKHFRSSSIFGNFLCQPFKENIFSKSQSAPPKSKRIQSIVMSLICVPARNCCKAASHCWRNKFSKTLWGTPGQIYVFYGLLSAPGPRSRPIRFVSLIYVILAYLSARSSDAVIHGHQIHFWRFVG